MNSSPYRKKHHSNLRLGNGFSLIELLVVIAIIALLAALLTPAIGGAMKRANSVQCKAALTQLGAAIEIFSHDHDDYFPPGDVPDGETEWGLWPGVMASPYNGPHRLAHYLRPYVGSTSPRTRLDGITCKAAVRAVGDERVRMYFLNHNVGDTPKSPWGRPGNPSQMPRRSSVVPSPARTWAAQDADQTHPIINPGWSTYVYYAPYLVHEDHRNSLFFDWHVESERVERLP